MSGIKQFIKDLLPPIIIKMVRPRPKPVVTPPEPVFETFEAATAECTKDVYENKNLVGVIVEKTTAWLESIRDETVDIGPASAYSILSVLNTIIEKRSDGPLHVLDYGGAAGAHYFNIRSMIPASVKLRWVVVETRAMAEKASGLSSEELKFMDNIGTASDFLGRIDLVHSSGTLNFVPEPYKSLDALLDLKADWMLFNRLCINRANRDVITIHESMLSWHGIGPFPEGFTDRPVKTPFVLLSESDFLRKLELNYTIKARFEDRSGIHAVEGEQAEGYGLLCKRK